MFSLAFVTVGELVTRPDSIPVILTFGLIGTFSFLSLKPRR